MKLSDLCFFSTGTLWHGSMVSIVLRRCHISFLFPPHFPRNLKPSPRCPSMGFDHHFPYYVFFHPYRRWKSFSRSFPPRRHQNLVPCSLRALFEHPLPSSVPSRLWRFPFSSTPPVSVSFFFLNGPRSFVNLPYGLVVLIGDARLPPICHATSDLHCLCRLPAPN